MSKPLVYSYVRFSSKPQEKGDSIARQENFIYTFAKSKGIEIDEKLRYNDYGVSGFKQDNIKEDGALKKFMELVESGKIAKGSFLVVENMDRFSRADVMTVNGLLSSIVNHGITFVTQLSGAIKETTRESINANPFELIIMLYEAQRGNHESQRKSTLLKEYWNRKRESVGAFLKKCPWWVRWDTEQSRYIEIPERADVIRTIFAWYSEGLGEKTIIKKLNQDGIPPAKGKKWGSYVQKILKFPAVIGEMTLIEKNGDESEPKINFYPAIISNGLWTKVCKLRELKRIPLANAINANTGTTGMKLTRFASNLFTNIAVCGYCGGKLHFKYGIKKLANGNKRKHKYLICVNKSHGVKCPSMPWRYEDFEESFLEFAREVSITQTDITNEENQIQLETSKLNAVIKRINNLETAIEEADDEDSAKGLAKKLKPHNDTRKTIQRSIASIRTAMEEKSKMNSVGMSSLNDLMKQPEDKSIRFAVAEQIRVYFTEVRLFSAGKIINREDEKVLAGGDEVVLEIMRQPRKHSRYYESHLRNGDIRSIVPDGTNSRKTVMHLDKERVQLLDGTIMELKDIAFPGATATAFANHIVTAFYMLEASWLSQS